MPPAHPSEDLAVHAYGRTDREAPTLLLLHGLTDSGRCWPDAVRRWQDGYRILAWDARGHGESPPFDADELAAGIAETMVADLVDLLERLAADGIAPPVLVAHSMGGGSAAAVAGQRPELVRAVVLEDPALGLKPDPQNEAARTDAAERLVERERASRDLAPLLAKGRREHPEWPDVEMEPWAEAKRLTDPQVIAQPYGLPRLDGLEAATAIAVPALVVTGTEALLVKGGFLPALQGLGNPNLSFEVVEGAGHCVRRDRADGYHAVVDPWVAEQLAR